MNLASRQVRTRDVAVIVALHDLNLASQYCDRIALLHDGEIHGVGRLDVLTPEAIKTVYGANVTVREHEGQRFLLPDVDSE